MLVTETGEVTHLVRNVDGWHEASIAHNR